jgi:hypothetical protein
MSDVMSRWKILSVGLDKGPGSALLTEGLGRCDQEHLPANLESSNPTNAALYQRLGFEALGVIRAGDSPPMVPMLRATR